NDTLSVQSIDQPTYILGGHPLDTEAAVNDQDVLNVNVQIGINGPEPGSAPDGLDQIPPAKATSNGVNAELTVDGGVSRTTTSSTCSAGRPIRRLICSTRAGRRTTSRSSSGPRPATCSSCGPPWPTPGWRSWP